LGNESLTNMSAENLRGGRMGSSGPQLSMEERVAQWRRVNRDNESLDCEIRERLLWVERWKDGREAKGMGVREMGEILSRRRWVAPEHARDMEWCRMKEGK